MELTQLNLHRLVLEDYCDQSSNNDYFEITKIFWIQDTLFQRLWLITILRALSGIKIQFSHSPLACEQSVNRAPDVMFLATFPCSCREFSMKIYLSFSIV